MSVYFETTRGCPVQSLMTTPEVEANAHRLCDEEASLGVNAQGNLYRIKWYEHVWNWLINVVTLGRTGKTSATKLSEVVMKTLAAVQQRLQSFQDVCAHCQGNGLIVRDQWVQEHGSTLCLLLGTYRRKPYGQSTFEPYENLGVKVLKRFDDPEKDRQIRDAAWRIETQAQTIRSLYSLQVHGKDSKQYAN